MTVCAGASCTEMRKRKFSIRPEEIVLIAYKKLCHRKCNFSGIKKGIFRTRWSSIACVSAVALILIAVANVTVIGRHVFTFTMNWSTQVRRYAISVSISVIVIL